MAGRPTSPGDTGVTGASAEISTPLGIGEELPFPRDSSLLDLVEHVVREHPRIPAVRHRDDRFSYTEIDTWADAVAAVLLTRGVRFQQPVPLLIGEGPEFVVGLLAAMKIGAPYVPVDPGWPEERLATVFRQLRPPAVLAVRATAPATVPAGLTDRLVLVDAVDPAGGADLPAERRRPGPTDLVYGYFTSGSTGTPKCALNHHRGLVNRLTAMSGRFGDGAGQVVLQNSRPTFDSAMWQVLWPLTTGGQVVLPDRRGILDLEETCHTIGRYGVTITDFVPSVLSALVTLLEVRPDLRRRLAGLAWMLVGGEAANAAVLGRLHGLLPGLRLTNTYGPTECSIGSVFHDIVPGEDPVPLGRPIPNTAAVVLDDRLRPVPPGVTGEIHIGGECVGAGYLDDPERTSRVFVPNPLSRVPGPLLYRTGDLGHVDPRGLLMFGGRRDDQVKVGGVRIELAEIERTLAAHPAVGDATVVTAGDGDARALVAFVTARGGEVATDDLLDHLRRELPAETVPRRLVVLAAMPLTPNGKTDRLALERLAARGTADDDPGYEPPTSPGEELVAAVWREVLDRPAVSATVPFTEYGATSLLVHRLGALLGDRSGQPVAVADLLAAPTVRAQAALLTGGPTRTGPDLAALARDAALAGLAAVQAPVAPARSRRLLLTGATGFIGAHVLAELLDRPDVETVCLVRAPDVRAGKERLAAVLRAYQLVTAGRQLPHRLATGQLRVLVGDLAAPALGLPTARFEALAGEIDGILHVGALVNLLHGYADHRAPNVLGTRELLRLALTGQGCRLHVLSTFSAFAAAELTGPPLSEEQLPRADLPPDDGYGQSKHVVEWLLDNARRHRVDSVVYRLGEVWPHRVTGVPNRASLAHSVVYACARTGGVFPTSAVTDHVPVDLVGRYLVAAATGRRPAGDRVHVLRPVPLPLADVMTRLTEMVDARPVGYPEFHRRVTELAESDGADERLVRTAMLLPPPTGGAECAPAAFDALFTDSSAHFEVRRILDYVPTSAALLTGAPLDDLTPFVERMTREAGGR